MQVTEISNEKYPSICILVSLGPQLCYMCTSLDISACVWIQVRILMKKMYNINVNQSLSDNFQLGLDPRIDEVKYQVSTRNWQANCKKYSSTKFGWNFVY